MPINITEVKAVAQTERDAQVSKELAKKYRVIAKRQAVLDAHTAAFSAKVKAFDDAVTGATSSEQVMAALEAHKFPASIVNLTAKND